MAVFDRLASVVLAVILLALGVVTIVEVVNTALGNSGYVVIPWDSLARFGREHAWSTAPVVAISGVVAGVGLLLLVAELWPRRPGVFTLSTGDELVIAGTTHRSLRRALATRATEVEGVTSATARLRRRTATVTAVTTMPDPGDLLERVTADLTGWVGGLGLTRPPRLRVRLHHRKR